MPSPCKTAGSSSKTSGPIRISSISTERRDEPALTWAANQFFSANISAGSIGKVGAAVIVLLPFLMALAERRKLRGRERRHHHRPCGSRDLVPRKSPQPPRRPQPSLHR